MKRRLLFRIASIGLAVASFAMPITPPLADAAVVFGGSCVMTIKVSFTPAMTAQVGSGDLNFDSTWAMCAGTDIDVEATISGGTSTGILSCGFITTGGGGTLTYGSANPGTFDVTIAGNAQALVFAMTPGDALIAGAGVLTTLGQKGSCLTGLQEITLTGVIVFSDPSV